MKHNITVPTDRPVTAEDLPDFVDRELVEGMSPDELRAFLDRLKRLDDEGLLDEQGRALLYASADALVDYHGPYD